MSEKDTNDSFAQSIEISLLRKYPESMDILQEAFDDFKNKSGSILELTEKVKEILGPEKFTSFINSNFRSFTPNMMTTTSIRTLK